MGARHDSIFAHRFDGPKYVLALTDGNIVFFAGNAAAIVSIQENRRESQHAEPDDVHQIKLHVVSFLTPIRAPGC